MSNKEKEVLLAIINLYKDMPFLWQKDNEDYLNKDLRNESFEMLLNVYKAYDPDVTMTALKKKLQNMRTFYSREYKKVQASKLEDSGERGYEPTLWYYDAFSFLNSATKSCDVTTVSCNIAIDDSSVTTDVCNITNDSLDNGNCSTDVETNPVVKIKKAKKRKKTTLQDKSLRLPSSIEKLLRRTDEQCEIFGRSVGVQLKDLSKTQLMIANKMISDVIYYGKLNLLNENSRVSLGTFSE